MYTAKRLIWLLVVLMILLFTACTDQIGTVNDCPPQSICLIYFNF